MNDLKIRGWSQLKRRMLYEGDLVGCELMLYTGIKDRHGKDIYEGDFVHLTRGIGGSYPVIFRDGAFCLGAKGKLLKSISFVKVRDEWEEGVITGRKERGPYNDIFEVVGNVFEGQTGRVAETWTGPTYAGKSFKASEYPATGPEKKKQKKKPDDPPVQQPNPYLGPGAPLL